MTPPRGFRDPATSIRRRLLNLARDKHVDYNLVLQRFAAERFLFRLADSGEVHRFVLKGAALFRVWTGEELRPTRDIDFLAIGLQDDAAIRNSLEVICNIPCPEDSVVFDPATIRIDTIRGQQPHGGLRARIHGSLGKARVPLRVDIGFGDVITPRAEVQEYPTLLDLPVPRLWTYPRETLVAEKFEAMVHLGSMNSRVKDIWDVVCVARRFPFDGETLQTAIAETFHRRGTSLAGERPVSLVTGYYEDTARARRWSEFHRQLGAGTDAPDRLVDAGEELRRFLGPVYDSLTEERPFAQAWPAEGPWQPLGPEPRRMPGANRGLTRRHPSLRDVP